MRSFSKPAHVSLISRVSSEIWLALLTIDVEGLLTHVVANSSTEVVSNSITFHPYPFDVLLPADSIEQMLTVKISIDNVDRLFVDALRAATNPIKFSLWFALASQPDTIELRLDNLESDVVEYDANRITATLAVNDIWSAKFPSIGGIYDPAQCPALF